MDKVREIALKALYKIDVEEGYSNIVLDELLSQNKKILEQKDVGFISQLVYGVTTWRLTLDTIVRKYSSIRIKKISPWILNILRMGIYQIIFLDKIPKSAAVNESVNLAKRYGHKSSSNFVNAILRKVEKNDFQELNNIKDNKERISKITSMPMWIIDELLNELSIEQVENICVSSNLIPNVSIRVNNLKMNKTDLKKRLEEKGINVQDGILDDFLVLDKVKKIEEMEEFKKGYFTVQDEAAGLAAKVLDPKPGEHVLDACSSPGGKTTYLAEMMKDKGKIDAWDIHEHRVKLVEKNANRLGLKIIDANVHDATCFDLKKIEKYDKILLDTPCLGIGVLRRKPDIKWQKNSENIQEITEIQKTILEICSKYLKKGGELVYSTCSILKSENIGVVENFLQKNKDFEIMDINLKNDNFFNKYIENNRCLQVYQNDKTDGFFICKMRKK